MLLPKAQLPYWQVLRVICTMLVIVCVVGAPVTPLGQVKKARAVFGIGDIVFDPGNHIENTLDAIADTASAVFENADNFKEYVLDPLSWLAAKVLIQAITVSTVNWINSGFQGAPAFVTDPAAFFADVADSVVGEFISQNGALSFMCQPFQAQIRIALTVNKSFRLRSQCTLTDVIGNIDNFFAGLEDSASDIGGWSQWYQVAAVPRGNIYGAYGLATGEIALRINGKSYPLAKLNDWGKGFLSIRDCAAVPNAKEVELYDPESGETTTSYEVTDPNELDRKSLTKTQSKNVIEDTTKTGKLLNPKTDCPLSTPGSVVENRLEKALGMDLESLGIADEIGEIIGALITQLTKQLLSATGLFGASSPSSQYGGQSYTEALTEEANSQYGQIRAVTAQEIDKNLDLENRLLGIKQSTLGVYDQMEVAAGQVYRCYQNKLSSSTPPLTPTQETEAQQRSQAATSTAQAIHAAGRSVREDVEDIQNLLGLLESSRDAIDTFSFENLTGLQDSIRDYSNLRRQLHTEVEVQQAQVEHDNVTSSSIGNTTLSDLRNQLTECQAFPANFTSAP